MQPTVQPTTGRRTADRMPAIPALDGIRAIAVLIVIASHAGLGSIVPGGFGVTLFFFLSGYLITTLLRVEWNAHGAISLREFYVRRTLRIMPPLYITMAVVAGAIFSGLLAAQITGEALVADALFVTNYMPNLSGSLPMPLWSLDVEEHFYLVFPTLFVGVLARMAPRRAAMTCLAICAGVLALRLTLSLSLSNYTGLYYWTHTRIDSILFGCCLALWRNPAIDRDPWRPRAWHVAAALSVLALCFVVRDPFFRETARYSLQGGALFVLFAFAVQAGGVTARVLDSPSLRVVALLSYTLYLVHMPALMLAEQIGLPAHALFGVAASFAYAWAMYVLVERPLGRLRKRLHARAGPTSRERPVPIGEGAATAG